MKILIIEDHPGIRFALEMALELEGHQPQSEDRGEAALAAMVGTDFDLILLDLNTNGISAEDFMARLGVMSAEGSVSRPVVGVLSASHGIELEARRIGADFWVRKPFEHEHLLERMEAAVRARGVHSQSSAFVDGAVASI